MAAEGENSRLVKLRERERGRKEESCSGKPRHSLVICERRKRKERDVREKEREFDL